MIAMAGCRHPSDIIGGAEGYADGAGLAASIDAEEPRCRARPIALHVQGPPRPFDMPKARYAEGSAQGIAAAPDRCDAEILAAAVTELEQLAAGSLRRRWRALVGGAVPPDLGRPLTLRMLAYKLQAQHLGDLDKASLRELSKLDDRPSGRRASDDGSYADSLASATDEDRGVPSAPAVKLPKSSAPRIARPGTLLIREYGGEPHRVIVLDEGVSWNGKTYESLSKVAYAITGTKWNGPRFFGLRDKVAGDEDDRRRQSTADERVVTGRGRAVRSNRSSASRTSS